MSSRISCWLHGHDWGLWQRAWRNILGEEFSVRFCQQCGARQSKPRSA